MIEYGSLWRLTPQPLALLFCLAALLLSFTSETHAGSAVLTGVVADEEDGRTLDDVKITFPNPDRPEEMSTFPTSEGGLFKITVPQGEEVSVSFYKEDYQLLVKRLDLADVKRVEFRGMEKVLLRPYSMIKTPMTREVFCRRAAETLQDVAWKEGVRGEITVAAAFTLDDGAKTCPLPRLTKEFTAFLNRFGRGQDAQGFTGFIVKTGKDAPEKARMLVDGTVYREKQYYKAIINLQSAKGGHMLQQASLVLRLGGEELPDKPECP